MKAALLVGPRKIEIHQVPQPEVKQGEILVKVKATAICGTDVGIYLGTHKLDYPLILGHETAGIVAKNNSEIAKIKEGDPVFVMPTISCGMCKYCRSGKENLCPHGGLLGREVPGSYADYVAVPAHLAFKLPEQISFVQATTINLLMTVVHAHRRVGIFLGSSVLVLGLGPAGLTHTYFARMSGAYPVIGIDRIPWRLEMGKRFGAHVTISTHEKEFVKETLSHLKGEGADLIIEATGAPEAIKDCYRLVKPGGSILQFGISAVIDHLDMYTLYFKEITVVGSRAMLAEDYYPALQIMRRDSKLFEQLVTHTIPLIEIEKGFHIMCGKKNTKYLRVVVLP